MIYSRHRKERQKLAESGHLERVSNRYHKRGFSQAAILVCVLQGLLGSRSFAQVITFESAYSESEVVAFVQITSGQLVIHDDLNCGASYRAQLIEPFKGGITLADATFDFSSQTTMQIGRYYLVFLVRRESSSEAYLLPGACNNLLPALMPLEDGRTLLSGTNTFSLDAQPNGLEFDGLWDFPRSVPFTLVRYETDLGGLIRKRVETSVVLDYLRRLDSGG